MPRRFMPRTLLVALACMLLLAGCGSSARAETPITPTTPTPVPSSTATTAPTPLPTVDAATLKTCGVGSPVLVGGLAVTLAPANLMYPGWTLPDDTPLKPLKIGIATQDPYPDLPASNPYMQEVGGGFDISVCNPTHDTHTLTSVSVRIASFQAYTGKLNVWPMCTSAYNTQSGVSNFGCGGGDFANEHLHATFASGATAGTTAVATQTGTSSMPGDPSPFPPLPLALAAGKTVSVSVGLTVPTTPGVYSFAFGVAVDGATPIYYSVSEPYLFAPVGQTWGGAGCTDPAMKTQIPATTTPTDYICPMAAK